MLKATVLLAAAAVQLGGSADPPATTSPTNPEVPSTSLYVGSERQLDVDRPWVPAVSIRIDGRLDEADWAEAPVLTGFTQYDPLEGVDASERTDVRLLMTNDAIYFGIHAFDRSGGVRATLSERDEFGFSDDYVRILLDTFNDQRRAYVFTVNPLGVQADGIWVEGRGGRGDPIDWSPDFLWESDGQVGSDGYTAEIRIPLKSLRFADTEVQDWGLQVIRQIQRTGYNESWAPVSGEQANRLAQAGRIRGLRDLERGMFLEINPVVTGTRQGSWDSDLSRLERAPSTGDFGLNLSYGITSNLTLDGTYNPDFSQVEADAGQIAVNERFALFFPEKRPFFLEGADIFSMPKQLVYTRSIVNPVAAAKLSGKVGGFSLAYLGAVDDVSVGDANPVVNLLRLKRDVPEHLDPERAQQLRAHRPHRRPHRGLAGRGALQHVARVPVVVELQHPREVGVPGPRPVHRRQPGEVGRLVAHAQRHRIAGRAAAPDARQKRALSSSIFCRRSGRGRLAAAQHRVDRRAVDLQSGGQAGHDGGQSGAVAFSGGDVLEHAADGSTDPPLRDLPAFPVFPVAVEGLLLPRSMQHSRRSSASDRISSWAARPSSAEYRPARRTR